MMKTWQQYERHHPATAEDSVHDDHDDGVASRLSFDRLHEVARFAAKAHASKVAYTAGGTVGSEDDGPRKSITYERMYQRIESISKVLTMELGLRRRDRVGIMLLNGPEYLESYYAISESDCISVHLNPRLAATELRPLIDDCQCRVIIAHASNSDIVRTLTEASLATSSCRHVIWVGGGPGVAPDIEGVGTFAYDEISEHGGLTAKLGNESTVPARCHVDVEDDISSRDGYDEIEDQVATLFYTSGTTGRPKGVMQTHQNLLRHALRTREALGWEMIPPTDDDTGEIRFSVDERLTWGHFGAMFHIGDSWSDFAITEVGGCHAFCPQFDLNTIVRIIERERVTHTKLVPTMIQLLIDSSFASTKSGSLSSLRLIMVSGSPLGEDVVRKAVKVLPQGCSIAHAYGMTETCGHTSFVNPLTIAKLPTGKKIQKLITCGQSIGGTRLAIADPKYDWDEDEDDADGGPQLLGPNEMGELLVSVRDRFDGYWRNPAESRRATWRGWLKTGDIGTIDEEGYLRIVDRKKDMIISGGENIFSAEVEQVLRGHSAVVSAAVYGVPHALLGELVEAVVVPREELRRDRDVLDLVANELKAHCKTNLAPFKVPRSFKFADSLPLSANGKVQKRILKDKAAAAAAASTDTRTSSSSTGGTSAHAGNDKGSNWRMQSLSEESMKEAEAQELEVLKRSLWQFLQSTGTHRNRMSALHTSQTAEVACFMRHLAHLKSDDAIRGDDSMAVHFLFPEHAMLATSAASSEVLTQIYDEKFPGMFGHLAARTKVFDSIVASWAPKVDQVVLLGAGYDTRAYRMTAAMREAKVFEVDAPGTQSAKLSKLKTAGLTSPNVTYVSVDFETQKFQDQLAERGFDPRLKTLWVWEFVSPYLSPSAVADTFAAIRRNSEPGSMLAFDYLYTEMTATYGGVAFHRGVRQSGERVRWTVAEGAIDRYLGRHGLPKVSEWSPKDLEDTCLTGADGVRRHRSFGFYSIVLCRTVTDEEHEIILQSLGAEPLESELERENVDADENGPLPNNPAPVFAIAGGNGAAAVVRKAVMKSLEKHLGDSASTMADSDTLLSAGLDSLMAVSFADDVRNELHVDISDTVVFEHASIGALVSHLSPQLSPDRATGLASDEGPNSLRIAVVRALADVTEAFSSAKLTIGDDESLLTAGIDSLMAISFAEAIRKEVGIDISDTVVFEHDTINKLVSHLSPSWTLRPERNRGAVDAAPATTGAETMLPPKRLVMRHLYEREEESKLLASKPYLPFWFRALGLFSYAFAVLRSLFAPLALLLSSTVRLRPLTPMPSKRTALTADDVFLSKLELTRTLFFQAGLDTERLEASLRYVLESFPSLSGCLTQRGGHLFVSYGGPFFAPLTVRSASFDDAHWKRKAPESSGKVIVRPEEYRIWLFLRTFGRAFGAYGSLLWPKPVMHIELLRVGGSRASANGDYLTVNINHAVADGFVFDKFLKCLSTAYNGEPLLSPAASAASASAASKNINSVRRAVAFQAPVLIDFQRRQSMEFLGYFQFQLRLSPAVMQTLQLRYGGADRQSIAANASDIVLTAVWDAKRRALKRSQHPITDVCVAFHRNVRSYVSGLESVQGNLFMSSMAMCPASSDVPESQLEQGRVTENIVRLKRAMLHNIDDVVDGMETWDVHGDVEEPRRTPSLIPISRIPELLDPKRTDIVYATASSVDAPPSPSIPPVLPPEQPPRALIHMNDLSHQQSRFVFADEGAVVGTESAHPERFDDAASGTCASSWGEFERQLFEHIGHIPIWFCRLMPDPKMNANGSPSESADLILLVSAGNGLVNP